MVDPRKSDARFPGRPKHPDFIVLSEVVQAHDALAEQLGMPTFEILGVDEKSLMYVIEHRLGIFSQSQSTTIFGKAQAAALYLDAFALGKAYAEHQREGKS